MKDAMTRYRQYAMFVSVLALGACGGAASTPATGAMPDRLATSVTRHPVAAHPDRRASWISPDLARGKSAVLFVSDSGTADVYIYSFPALKVIGTITGFTQPQGECSDTKGNVWVTDTSVQTIYELDHHGRLENELTDTQGYPVGCAWDATTGNLAVMNIFAAGSSSGGVIVYLDATRAPSLYQNSNQYFYNFGGYDTSGNLFFDGRDANGNFMLSELPKGAKSAHTVKLTGGTIYFPGMVQWVSTKHDLIVGDQSCGDVYTSCLYSVAIPKSGGVITGRINLKNSSGGQICDLVQGVKYNTMIAGSDFNFCGSEPSTTYQWPYPGGGAPGSHNSTTDSVPVGAAISWNRGNPDQRAWMDGGVGQQDLLYVSNGNGEVTVYRYWQHTLAGVLTNFTQPMGECADSSHNVYITDYAAKQILEYAHGGTKPLKKFDDAPDSPYTCAVDPITGNLAVANDDGTSQQGNLAIWNAASGKRITYPDSALGNFLGCAYDDNGNLLTTNGRGYSAPASFAWLPKGGSKLVNLIVPGPRQSWRWSVSGIQWDGKYFALDDYDIYRISLQHGQAYYAGSTQLDPGSYAPYGIYDNAPGQQGTQVVAGIDDDSGSFVDYFHYPAGGSAIDSISHGVDRPFGVVVSYKLKK